MSDLSFKTVSANKSNVEKNWVLVDVEDLILGRVASQIAIYLRGKHKPNYTPHVDCGDNVIIINADKVKLTGNKLNDKTYYSHTCFGNVQAFFPEHLKNHINNEKEWINKSNVKNWNGKNMYVLQEGNMSNTHKGFVFLSVPSNSNKKVWVNLFTLSLIHI